jgi:hypothetical protein
MREVPLWEMRPAPLSVEGDALRHDALSAPTIAMFPCLPRESAAARKAHTDHLDLVARVCHSQSFARASAHHVQCTPLALCRALGENAAVCLCRRRRSE